MEESNTGLVPHEEQALVASFLRAEQALAECVTDAERLAIRDGARAAAVVAREMGLRDLEVNYTILKARAERAIAQANPAKPPPGKASDGDRNTGVTISRMEASRMRAAHDHLSDDEFEAVAREAQATNTPITRKALTEMGKPAKAKTEPAPAEVEAKALVEAQRSEAKAWESRDALADENAAQAAQLREREKEVEAALAQADREREEREAADARAAQVATEAAEAVARADAAEKRAAGAAKKKSTVKRRSGDEEWYTPPEVLALAREAMGGDFDFDPAMASVDLIQAQVGAARWYTKDDDSLRPDADWTADRLWMNPPYTNGLVGRFVDRLIAEYDAGTVKQAIVLTNVGTETRWGQRMLAKAAAVCFYGGRMKFVKGDGEVPEGASAISGQMLCYFGGRPDSFRDAFKGAGVVVRSD